MKYTNEQLCFARSARCKCGAGLAYPNDYNIRGAWSCSAILRGESEQTDAHQDPFPFAFYEIKSEHQTRGVDETTRPGGPIPREQLVYCGPELVDHDCPSCNGTGKVKGPRQ